MRTRLESGAEVHKLAHQLGVPAERLHFLAGVAPAELRALRHQIGEALFRADRHHFTKVVAVSRIVPVALAARITEHALTPLLAARTAELLDPPRAVELVGRLSDGYLADVAAAMDPARATDVIATIPPERVAAVGAELARRGEWVVMGGFVSAVSLPALRAAVAVLDGEHLLRIGFVLDELTRLDAIADALRDEQLDALLRAAAELDLWTELAEVLANLGEDRVARLAGGFARSDDTVRGAFLAAVADGDLAASVLAMLAAQ